MKEPDEFQYSTTEEGTMMIAMAINEILFWEKMKKLMPLVAKELIKMGVDFSKVKVQSS